MRPRGRVDRWWLPALGDPDGADDERTIGSDGDSESSVQLVGAIGCAGGDGGRSAIRHSIDGCPGIQGTVVSKGTSRLDRNNLQGSQGGRGGLLGDEGPGVIVIDDDLSVDVDRRANKRVRREEEEEVSRIGQNTTSLPIAKSASAGSAKRRGRPPRSDLRDPAAIRKALVASDRAKVRAQGRLRSQRLRKKRATLVTAPVGSIGVAAFTGFAIEPRSARRYTECDVDWIVRVGTCPSAGGARAPLAGVLSHIRCEVSRWTVEAYRWRAYLYMAMREKSLFLEFLRNRSLGLTLRFDETPMRLYVDGKFASSSPVMVRCVSSVSGDGVVLSRSPTLVRPFSTDTAGLLGALRLDHIGLRTMCEVDGKWKFLLMVTDGAAVNKSIARHVIKECERYPTLIVIFGLCWAHTLSNSTKIGLGSFAFGQWLRLAHALQARSLSRAVDHCRRMICDEAFVPDTYLERRGADVWPEFVHLVLGARGPFAPRKETDASAAIVANAMRLFPDGPPVHGRSWSAAAGSHIDDYAGLVHMLLGRTIPIPVSTRWHTVERCAWFVLGLRSFGLLSHILPPDASVNYWPGDVEDETNCDPASYRIKCSDRMTRLQNYVGSADFVLHMLSACVSSMPRWRFAQVLDSSGISGGVRGVAAALSAYLECLREILSGRNALAEYFIDNETNADVVRLHVWRALAASTVYLSYKNLPYTTAAWRVVRGESDDISRVTMAGAAPCCADSGLAGKIAAHFGVLQGGAKAVSSMSLAETLKCCGETYTGKGGSANVECERQFSACRTLGLKTPHRPLKLSTLCRELCIKYYLKAQADWFDSIATEVFGGAELMRQALARKPVRFNAFTAFSHSLRRMPVECSSLWNRLDGEAKSAWEHAARSMNESDARERAITVEGVADRGSRGPLGSIDRRCPVDKADVMEKLHAVGSPLAASWKRPAVKELVVSLDAKAPVCPVDSATMESARFVRLPGEKCPSCETTRAKFLRTLSDFRRIVCEQFHARNGRDVGLTVGLVFDADEAAVWFDVVCVVKKPEKILCWPLRVTECRVFLHAELGEFRAPAEVALEVPDVFDGRSMCLIDYCYADGRDGPTHLLLPSKVGASSADGYWALRYEEECNVERISRRSTDDVLPRSSRRGGLAPRASQSGNVLEAYCSVFGNEGFEGYAVEYDRVGSPIDSEHFRTPEDLDGPTLIGVDDDSDASLIGATASEVEAVTKLRRPIDDRVDISHRLRGALDTSKYGVCLSDCNGFVTAYWRVVEKNSHRQQYRSAALRLSRIPGARRLTASKSSLRSKYDFETCIGRSVAWQAWHSAWVYGVAPAVDLPPSMPIPEDLESIRNWHRASVDAEAETSEDAATSSRDRSEGGSVVETSSMESTSEGTIE